MAIADLRRDLRAAASPAKARILCRFFKTGKGEYGEGDKFLGVVVPAQRKIARAHFKTLRPAEVDRLMRSPWHEERLVALFVQVLRFQKGDEGEREAVFRSYCSSTRWINNWDLVDSSAPYIVGPYLEKRDRTLLYRWCRSRSLWERRISILSTFHYIKLGEFGDSLALAGELLRDEHDLIHKAVGWMLREIGKRDRRKEEAFLDRHAVRMPRTMLRYAIEHFPEKRRKTYLTLKDTQTWQPRANTTSSSSRSTGTR